MTEKNKTKARKKKSVSARKTATPVAVNRRREWRFELPLPAEIAGQLPQGKQFRKKTILENISSTGAYFTIDSNLVVGSKVHLGIDLPKELTEGKKIKLCLDGVIVRLEKKDGKKKKTGVAVKFNRNFHFQVED